MLTQFKVDNLQGVADHTLQDAKLSHCVRLRLNYDWKTSNIYYKSVHACLNLQPTIKGAKYMYIHLRET